MLHPWYRLFFNIQQLSLVNSAWLHFVQCYIYHKAWSQEIFEFVAIELLSQRTLRVIVTQCKVYLGCSTFLKMLSIGTNVYVYVCHIKILARWQHDKMVSISATLDGECLKIIVACQEFKMGYFPWMLSLMSDLKN